MRSLICPAAQRAFRVAGSLAIGAILMGGIASSACGDDDQAETVVATPSPGSRTGTPSSDPTNTPTDPGTAESATPAGASATPTETPARARVIAGAYEAVHAFPNASFPRMVALVPIPGDESHAAVVTQQDGMIYRVSVTDDAEAPTVFLDLSRTIIQDPANEEGLLGLVFSPGYASDRRLFVAYSGGGPRRNTVARYTAPGDAADPASGRVILEVEDFAGNHNGGAVEFGRDGYLYVALGDGGGAGDPQGNGQNLNALLGKILRLDVSGETYTVPAGNPFIGSGRGEIWAYGLRNPWRFTFDRATGDMWVGDVGQGSWEEVNRIEPGGNYGWDTTEGPDCFGEVNCDRTGLIGPRAAYRTHEEGACAVTGGYVYRGASMPELAGWYIYGDFCSGHVWAFDTEDAASEPVLLMDTDHSIASFAQDPTGEIYLVTFNEAIFRIARR